LKSCPRRGIAWLTTNGRGVWKDHDIFALPTTCKTKGCPVCQHKVRAKFGMMVEYGCLTLGRTYFTTLTLRAGSGLAKDAVYVRQVWKKFKDYLSSKYQILEWVKVVELTKQNQPHLHLVLHLGEGCLRAACETKAKYNERWLGKRCECLEHTFSAAWQRVTGDSFVVDVKETLSPTHAGSYLGKYLGKGILYKDRLSELGFKRSWARSKGWPFDQLRLRQSLEGGWKERKFTYGRDKVAHGLIESGMSAREWLKETEWLNESMKLGPLQREGTDLIKELDELRRQKAASSIPSDLRRRILIGN
jgi:hypothetical protein